jgi:hypothetical protein
MQPGASPELPGPSLRCRMARAIAVLKLSHRVKNVITFAQLVSTSMTNNASFPSPNPPLATFEADVAALNTAETAALARAKGAVEIRNAKLAVVHTDLKSLLAYVQGVADAANPSNAEAIIESSGMTVRKVTLHDKPAIAVKQLSVSWERRDHRQVRRPPGGLRLAVLDRPEDVDVAAPDPSGEDYGLRPDGGNRRLLPVSAPHQDGRGELEPDRLAARELARRLVMTSTSPRPSFRWFPGSAGRTPRSSGSCSRTAANCVRSSSCFERALSCSRRTSSRKERSSGNRSVTARNGTRSSCSSRSALNCNEKHADRSKRAAAYCVRSPNNSRRTARSDWRTANCDLRSSNCNPGSSDCTRRTSDCEPRASDGSPRTAGNFGRSYPTSRSTADNCSRSSDCGERTSTRSERSSYRGQRSLNDFGRSSACHRRTARSHPSTSTNSRRSCPWQPQDRSEQRQDREPLRADRGQLQEDRR